MRSKSRGGKIDTPFRYQMGGKIPTVEKYQRGGKKGGKKGGNKSPQVDLRFSTVNKQGKIGPRYTHTDKGIIERTNAGAHITHPKDGAIYRKFMKEGPPKRNPDNINIPSINPPKKGAVSRAIEKLRSGAAEVKYQLFDKGTIRDWKWQRDNPEGYHWNMIRKGRDFDGGNTRKQHGGPIYNHKGMKVPGMRKGR
jgi:hypothetical protein